MSICQCTIVSGPNKGQQCPNKTKAGSPYCGKHQKGGNATLSDLPNELLEEISEYNLDLKSLIQTCNVNTSLRKECPELLSKIYGIKLPTIQQYLQRTINVKLTDLMWLIQMIYFSFRVTPDPKLLKYIHQLPDEYDYVDNINDLYPTHQNPEYNTYAHMYGGIDEDFDPQNNIHEFTTEVNNFIDWVEIQWESVWDYDNITKHLKTTKSRVKKIMKQIERLRQSNITPYLYFSDISPSSNITIRGQSLHDGIVGTIPADWLLKFVDHITLHGNLFRLDHLADALFTLKSHHFDNTFERVQIPAVDIPKVVDDDIELSLNAMHLYN